MKRLVRGESMLPSLNDFDECLTVLFDPAQARIGDILLYKSGTEEDLKIHRVIRIDKKNNTVTLKGDNVPGLFDTVDPSRVAEKAVAVMRNGKRIDVSGPIAIFFGTLMALLSRYDMTPSLARRKVLDPITSVLSAGASYALLRKTFFYGKVSFASFENPGGITVHAYAGGRVIASADLRKKGSDILALIDVKWRDRNAYFASLFLDKVAEVSEKRFGNFSKALISPVNWPGMGAVCAGLGAGGHVVIFMEEARKVNSEL